MRRKIRQVSSSVATVMPEIGFEVEPTWPVNRDETVTNRKPNARIMTAPSTFMCSGVATVMAAMMPSTPTSTHFIGMSWSVRAVPTGAPAAAKSPKLARMLCQIVGSAWNRLMMPAVATAPAPM